MKLRFFGIFILFFLAAAIFAGGKYFKLSQDSDKNAVVVAIGASEVKAEVASTPPERGRGLSGRKELAADEGMLFVFGAPRRYSFWMKNMLFPVDMIWIGEDKTVVDVTNDVRPESYPRHFRPRYPAQYVLEVKSGWAQTRGIEAGDEAEFSL